MYIPARGVVMLRYKHLRLDQAKIAEVKRILKARTDTEALDRALEQVIQAERERLRRKRVAQRLVKLRKSLGGVSEDPAEWVRIARREKGLANDSGS